MMVPTFDGSRSDLRIGPELQETFHRLLQGGQYILGQEVAGFEDACARFLGVRHAVGVASGTDALAIGLRCCGVTAGDYVVTSPFTFFATAEAICQLKAHPVFIDVNPVSMNIDPSALGRFVDRQSEVHNRLCIDPRRVRALLPVHLFGLPAAMDPILRLASDLGAPVVGDAAQAFGSRYRGASVGALGDAAAFSFFPTKNLGGFGDGGLITTNDDAIADRVRLLRSHGQSERYVHVDIGTNSRLDALQAALLNVKLGHLDDALRARKEISAVYRSGLADVGGLVCPEQYSGGAESAPNQFTVRVDDGNRDALMDHLRSAGVASRIYYPLPLHLQPALDYLGYRCGDFPVAEALAKQVLSLPLFPGLDSLEQAHIVSSVRDGLDRIRSPSLG